MKRRWIVLAALFAGETWLLWGNLPSYVLMVLTLAALVLAAETVIRW